MNASAGSMARRGRVLFVDAHVHIYDVYDLDALLDAAVGNFERAARANGAGALEREGMLLLTETARDHAFDALAAGERKPRRWQVAATQEPAVLRLSRDPATILWLVAGRQVATREDLEVLALGTTRRFPDREPIQASVAASDESAAMTALPWGFGKWWGARGTIIQGLMRSQRPRPLFLGDNGGRLSLTAQPRLLRDGERAGHRVLPGTDPLPFAGQERRVGGFGMFLTDWELTDRPLAQLVARLSAADSAPHTYGSLTGPIPFVRLQIAMQLRKRRGAAA
jgi:hypothetical protein